MTKTEYENLHTYSILGAVRTLLVSGTAVGILQHKPEVMAVLRSTDAALVKVRKEIEHLLPSRSNEL